MSTDAAEAPTRRRRRPSWTAGLGLALVLVGLSILGWLAWEFWGTNWVSHRTQARVITQIEQGWQRGKPNALVPEGPGGDPVAALAARYSQRGDLHQRDLAVRQALAGEPVARPRAADEVRQAEQGVHIVPGQDVRQGVCPGNEV